MSKDDQDIRAYDSARKTCQKKHHIKMFNQERQKVYITTNEKKGIKLELNELKRKQINKGNILTIWSFIVFPSCFTVRIFCQTKYKHESEDSNKKNTCFNLQERNALHANCAYITFQIWIIQHLSDKKSNQIANII